MTLPQATADQHFARYSHVQAQILGSGRALGPAPSAREAQKNRDDIFCVSAIFMALGRVQARQSGGP